MTLFDEIKKCAELILSNEGVKDVKVIVKPGVSSTYFSFTRRLIQFGEDRIMSSLGFTDYSGAARWYLVKNGKLFTCHAPCDYLNTAEKLTSTIIEEVTHAIVAFKGGARHGHDVFFRNHFIDFYNKYKDKIASQLIPWIATFPY